MAGWAAAAQVGGQLLSSFLGSKAEKKKNKLIAEQTGIQRDLADQQIDVSKYIQQLSQQLMGQGSGLTDPYGGGSYYDPVSKTYKYNLSPTQQGLQGASDREELARGTIDQGIRRQGLYDAEGIRGAAANEADTALRDMSNFKQGIGQENAGDLASQLRLNRQASVNAGYDDSQRAANTISLRTGASSGDALSRLAQNRTRDIAQTRGNPELEGLQLADTINSGRQQKLSGLYDMFSGKGSNFYDAGFQSAPYADQAIARSQDQQKLDLGKFEAASGGSSGAAAGIGSAAAGLRQAFGQQNAGTSYNALGQAASGFGDLAASLIKSYQQQNKGAK